VAVTLPDIERDIMGIKKIKKNCEYEININPSGASYIEKYTKMGSILWFAEAMKSM
jgi:hypothetical protein